MTFAKVYCERAWCDQCRKTVEVVIQSSRRSDECICHACLLELTGKLEHHALAANIEIETMRAPLIVGASLDVATVEGVKKAVKRFDLRLAKATSPPKLLVHDVRYPSDLQGIPAPLTGREKRMVSFGPLLYDLNQAYAVSQNPDGIEEAISIVERFVNGKLEET